MCLLTNMCVTCVCSHVSLTPQKRYEAFIFLVPPVLAPLLAAMYVRHFGRKSGIMLGCGIMLLGQVSRGSKMSDKGVMRCQAGL